MDKTNKSLAIVALVLGLLVVLEQQSQLVHAKSCCPSSAARNVYNVCRFKGSRKTCAQISGCKIIQGARCVDPYVHQESPYSDSAEAANVVLEFCKSGCTSAVCNNIVETAAHEEDANDAVDRCGEACYRFCTNHVDTATNVAY